ncbi:MAG: histidinol dehydrogenase, partial [Mesorhizobium sp.]
MAITLRQSDADFEQRFAAFLMTKREVSADVDAVVRDIIARVRAEGDTALIDYTQKFGGGDLAALGIAVSAEDIAGAYAEADPATVEALKFARDRIRSHHQRQKPQDERYTDAAGVELGSRWTAIEAVGLYVPGGTASYPSSVLMNAVPAKVAGVERIVMVVPAPQGVVNPLVLVAADISGVSEIYRVGGAQAIAALAYGTQTIKPVAKIVGPGNAYVAAAKRRVFGTVGIDMIAGPSEVLVVADGGNDPEWIAADLLAQAEHDVSAQSILITDDPAFG